LRPSFRDVSSFFDIVYYEDQLVAVIAVLHFDVDTGVRHFAAKLPELAGFTLTKLLNDHLANPEYSYAFALQNFSCGGAIFEQKMRDGRAANQERAASLNAYSGASQGFTYAGEFARTMFEKNTDILHEIS